MECQLNIASLRRSVTGCSTAGTERHQSVLREMERFAEECVETARAAEDTQVKAVPTLRTGQPAT